MSHGDPLPERKYRIRSAFAELEAQLERERAELTALEAALRKYLAEHDNGVAVRYEGLRAALSSLDALKDNRKEKR